MYLLKPIYKGIHEIKYESHNYLFLNPDVAIKSLKNIFLRLGNLKVISFRGISEPLTKEKLFNDVFKRMRKIEDFKIGALLPHNSKSLTNLLKYRQNTPLRSISLFIRALKENELELCLKLDLTTERIELAVNFYGDSDFLFPIREINMLQKIKTLQLTFFYNRSKKLIEKEIAIILPQLINLEHLTIFSRESTFRPDFQFDFTELRGLKHFKYKENLENIKINSIPNEIITLHVRIDSPSLNLLEAFTKQLRKLTILEELRVEINEVNYVNEFLHDLPHNLSSLKKVSVYFERSKKICYEHNLRMNTFLDWIISLPNLEEIFLSHPYIFCCYCNHLEGYKASSKLRRVSIKETSNPYNCSFLEGEYIYDDLKVILDIFVTENLVHLEFLLHFELFNQNAIDLLDQKLSNCRKLEKLYLNLSVMNINEKLTGKIQKILHSLYYVEKKSIVLRHFGTNEDNKSANIKSLELNDGKNAS